MSRIEELPGIVGKIIDSATYMKKPDYDDRPFLLLRFTDGTHCYVHGFYGGFTGSSEDEYPAYIRIAGGEYFERDVLPHLVKAADDE